MLTPALPACVGLQGRHRNGRLLKNTRHINAAVHHGKAGLPGLLVKVEIHIESREPRHVRYCGNVQLADPPPGGVGLRRAQSPLPTGLQTVHPAFGRKPLQTLTQVGIQRQATGNLGQRSQVQLLGSELAARGLSVVRLLRP